MRMLMQSKIMTAKLRTDRTGSIRLPWIWQSFKLTLSVDWVNQLGILLGYYRSFQFQRRTCKVEKTLHPVIITTYGSLLKIRCNTAAKVQFTKTVIKILLKTLFRIKLFRNKSKRSFVTKKWQVQHSQNITKTHRNKLFRKKLNGSK